jgi:hypothetical protein
MLTTHLPSDATLTIRTATPADADELAYLAELDSSHVPTGNVMVAEVGGKIWAALSLDDSHAITDPFHPSAEALLMVAERARSHQRRTRRRYRRVRPLFA